MREFPPYFFHFKNSSFYYTFYHTLLLVNLLGISEFLYGFYYYYYYYFLFIFLFFKKCTKAIVI